MITWTESYQKFQRKAGDTSDDTLTQAKADINLGSHKFNASLNRYFNRRSKTTDVADAQQYYQMPPDCIRPIGVVITLSNGRKYPASQVRSEDEWRALNTANQSSSWPTLYFVRGSDEIGLYPIPSDDVTDGLELYYEPRDKDLSAEDYTTGTVTVTQGATTITHSGTGFTESMVGRVFKTTDGSDGHWYKIRAYGSSSSLTLEEPYIGVSGGGKTFKIGETFLFPEEYHEAPTNFALSEFFDERNQPERAAYHLRKFELAVKDAREKYASSSQSRVITEGRDFINWWQIPPEPITGV